MDKISKNITIDFQNYLSTNKNKTIVNYCIDNNVFLDINVAINFLTDSARSDLEKIDIIQNVLDFKQIVLSNRKHIKGYEVDLKSLYKDKYREKNKINYKEFEQIYYAIDHLRLNVSKTYDKNINKIIGLFSELEIDNNKKCDIFIDLLRDVNPNNIFDSIGEILEHYSLNIDEKQKYSDILFEIYKLSLKSLKVYGPKIVEELLLNAYSAEDIFQVTSIYDIVNRNAKDINNKSILLIEPCLSFAELMIKKYNDCKITIIFKNINMARICDFAYNDNLNIKVCSLDNYEKDNEYRISYYDLIISFACRLNDAEKVDIFSGLYNRTSNESVIYIFDVNHSILNNNGIVKKFILDNHLCPTEIVLYHDSIRKIGNIRELSLLIANVKPNNELTNCYQYKLDEENNIQYLSKKSEPIKYDYLHVKNTDKTLNQLFRDLQRDRERKTDKTNSKSEIYRISKRVGIKYVIPRTFKASADLIDYNNKKISNTHKQANCHSYDEAMNWIKSEYPFGKNNKGENICSVVSDYYSGQLKSISLSYNDVLCLFSSSLDTVLDGKWELAKNMTKYMFSRIDFDMLTGEQVVDELCENIPLDSGVEVLDDIISIYYQVNDFAIKKGYAKKCVLSEYIEIVHNARSDLNQLRLALTTRSLSKQDYRKAVLLTTNRIKYGSISQITVLFKLLSPLEYGEVSAITLDDIYIPKTFNEDNKIVVINVCKTIIKKHNKYEYSKLEKKEKYRKVVLMEELGSCVLKQYESQKRKYIDELNSKRIPLIEGDGKTTTGEKIIKPEIISKLCKKVIKELNLGEEIVKLFNDNIETDLKKYKGDFLLSNFRYYLTSKGVCNFNRNEIEVYFGNKPYSTHAKNYIDYETDAMLLETYNKLNYLYTVISNEQIREGECVSYKGIFISYSTHNYKNLVRLQFKAKQGEILNINNKYGFNLIVSRIRRQNV